MNDILFAFNCIAPLLLTMAAGMLFRKLTAWDISFFKKVNSLGFKLFLPCQLFLNVYNLQSFSDVNWPVVIYVLCTIPLSLCIGLISARLFTKDVNQKGVIVQGSFRSNTAIIGMALTESIGGAYVTEALAFTSLVAGMSVPIFNTLAVVILTLYAAKSENTGGSVARKTVKKIFTNPLIIGCLSGFVCILIRSLLKDASGVPVFTVKDDLPAVYSVINSFSKVSSTLMIFGLGAVLDFRAIGSVYKQVIHGTLLRLVICPFFSMGCAILLRDILGLSAIEVPVLISLCASPVAVSSGVMVQEMGGDSDLANHLIVWSSVFSMFTMFLFILFFRTLGIL